MTKLEKVIKGLELHLRDDFLQHCEECPYNASEEEKKVLDWDCHWDELKRDALELLKAKYKPRESRKMLPCKCGCKRREHWYGSSYDNSEGLKCTKCGFEVWGKNNTDVIQKWNEAVTQNDEA